MNHDPTFLLETLEIATPLIGCYDAPHPEAFAPLTRPTGAQQNACVFKFYEQWLRGRTLVLTRDCFGCGGAGHWLFGHQGQSREAYLEFLVDGEGLKASHALMNQWLDVHAPYRAQHPQLLVGPLRPGQEAYLKTISFYVNPDQLSMLLTGAQYHAAPGNPPPVLAAFGSGCMQLLPLFDDLSTPQAIVGATDIAMRQWLPPETLAFTVTLPMFGRLCALDERSFLAKPFWKNLRRARKT